jgi:phage-related protein
LAVTITIKGQDETGAAFSSVEQGLGGIGQAAQSAGSGVGGFFSSMLASAGGFLAANVIGGITSQIGGLVSGMITGNAAFETYQTQFQVLLGSADAAKQRLADLAAFGAATPFELPEVVQADKVLQSFGLEAENTAARFGKSGAEIRTIAGDVASGTGASFTEIAGYLGKFASGATGEAMARFQELGIVTKTELAQMGVQFNKAGSITSPLDEAMTKVLAAMQGKFGGMMAAQSATFNGMLSNLQDWIGQTTRALGAPIFEAIKPQLASLLTALNNPAIAAAVAQIGAALGNLAQGAIAFITNTAIPALVSAWSTIGPAVAAAGGVLQSVWGIFTQLASAATGWGANIVNQLAGGMMAAAGAVVGALRTIGAVITSWLRPGSPPKLLPDLTTWGTGAATAYMEGWGAADFSALHALGDSIHQELTSIADVGGMQKVDIIPTLFGTRTAIEGAINELHSVGSVSEASFQKIIAAAGPAGASIAPMVRAFFDLEKASRDVAAAEQDVARSDAEVAAARKELQDVTDRYAATLKPLNKELAAISEQKNDLQDQERIAELQKKIDSGELDANEQKIAQLEILEIQKRDQIEGIQDEQSAAEEVAQTHVDAAEQAKGEADARLQAAKTTQQAAQQQLDTQKAALDAGREQNSLIKEQTDLLAQMAKAGAGGGGGGGGGIGGGLAAGLGDLKAKAEETKGPLDGLNQAIADTTATANELGSQASTTAGLVIGAFAPIGATLGPMISGVVGVVTGAITAIAGGISQSQPAIDGLVSAWSQGVGAIGSVLGGVVEVVTSVLGVIQGTLSEHGSAMVATFMTTWATVSQTTASVLSGLSGIITPILGQIAAFVAANGGQISQFISTTWSQVASIIQGAMGIIHAVIVPQLQAVAAYISTHGAQIQAVFQAAWTIISTTITTVLATIQGLITASLQVIQGNWTGAWETIKSTCATIVTGIVSVMKANLDLLNGVFDLAMGGAVEVVAGYVGKFVSVGGDVVNGVVDGVKKNAAKLMSAMQSLASDALNAARQALGISSPSKVAAEEVGLPFVQGIVDGISKSSGLIKNAAKVLSKQLTEEMQNVAKAAADAFAAVLHANLEAGVGFAGTALSNEQALEGLTGKSSDAIGKIKDQITAANEKQQQTDEDYTQAKKKRDEDYTEAKQKRDEDYADKVATINERITDDEADRKKEIDKLKDTTGLSDEERAQKLADITAKYDDKRAKNEKDLANLKKDYDKATTDALRDYTEKAKDAADAYAAKLKDLKDQLADLNTQLIGAQSTDTGRAALAEQTRQQLAAAQAEADQLRKSDPAAADKLFTLRSKYILQEAQLRAQMIDARNKGEQGTVDDLQTQLDLMDQQYVAEQKLFASNAQSESPYKALNDDLADLGRKLEAEVVRDQNFYNLTDRNNIKMRNKIQAELDKERAALGGVQDLMTQVGSAMSQGIDQGLNDGGLTDGIKAAMDAAVKAAREALGIASPSKVMAETVGKPSGQGILAGLSASLGDMEGTVLPLTGLSVTAPLGAPQSTQTNVTHNYNLTIHTTAPSEPIVQDFAMLRSMAAAT